MKSWIKIDRSIITSSSVTGNSDKMATWLVLLVLAQHSYYNYKGIDLEPGELITTIPELTRYTGIKRSTLGRILSAFEAEKMISQTITNKNRKITITNYQKYQFKYEKENCGSQNSFVTDNDINEIERDVKKSGSQNVPQNIGGSQNGSQSGSQNSFVTDNKISDLQNPILKSGSQNGRQSGSQNPIYNLIHDKNVLTRMYNKRPPLSPPQAEGRCDLQFFSFHQNSFNQFEAMYEKKFKNKRERSRCYRKWSKLDKSTIEAILQHVPKYCSSVDNTRYLLRPINYLLDEQWLQPIENQRDSIFSQIIYKSNELYNELRGDEPEEIEPEIIDEPISNDQKKDLNKAFQQLVSSKKIDDQEIKLPDNYGCNDVFSRQRKQNALLYSSDYTEKY